MVDRKAGMNRRSFLELSGATVAAATTTSALPGEFAEAKYTPEELAQNPDRQVFQSQCPYCGVGCGTLIQVENNRIVGVSPDKLHPTNKGVQCIKGLNAHEPTYRDRLTKVLIRKDMSDPDTGYISKTKGSFSDDDFREATYEEAEELVAEKIAGYVKKYGGNSVGLSGSGQLTMEAQWIENLLMKGVIGSNSIEANARMCMTSAVTGYFHSYGSDTPPTSYDDIEQSDMVTFWGHNARAAHPVLFWRVADHKTKHPEVPTLVADPRRTGTVTGLEDINPRNSHHFQTLNGDISYLNAIAHVVLTKHPEAIMPDEWLDRNTTGWREYVQGVRERYSPQQVVDRLRYIDEGRVTVEQIEHMGALWAEASIKGRRRGVGGVLTYWGIGYNQMLHGQHNTISIINLHLLTGNVGRPGCGTHSQTGQPNAMSERLMGGLTSRLPFNKGIDDVEWRDWIADRWRIPRQRLAQTATQPNPMAIGMMERALKDDLKAMFWMYTTHIHLPDLTTLVRPALKKMFCVVQDIYRHAPNVLYADVVFPAQTWGEWPGGVYIQSERRLYVNDGIGRSYDEQGNLLTEARPDMDMAIDKCISIGEKLGLNVDEIIPYKRRTSGHYAGSYDPEEVFADIIAASKGSDADLTGMLEVKERDGTSLYDQLRALRGIQWPAATYEIAKAGGTPRRYLGQEDWENKPYGPFPKAGGKAKFKLCEQDYGENGALIKEVTEELTKFGETPGEGPFLIDNIPLLERARDNALTPELPHLEFYRDQSKTLEDAKDEDKYPFWLGLGIVYEHFHPAKTIRGGSTLKLVPEQYVEVNEEDAARYGLEDGETVRVVTRRDSYEARISVGLDSMVRPARNECFPGYLFSPWNLSVADSADPKKNRWLVNAVSHRAWDPVSGQADYKKCAARIEKI